MKRNFKHIQTQKRQKKPLHSFIQICLPFILTFFCFVCLIFFFLHFLCSFMRASVQRTSMNIAKLIILIEIRRTTKFKIRQINVVRRKHNKSLKTVLAKLSHHQSTPIPTTKNYCIVNQRLVQITNCRQWQPQPIQIFQQRLSVYLVPAIFRRALCNIGHHRTISITKTTLPLPLIQSTVTLMLIGSLLLRLFANNWRIVELIIIDFIFRSSKVIVSAVRNTTMTL